MDRLKACILGATGAAGQNIVESLRGHPWFEIDCLAASSRSAGKRYRKAIDGAVFFENPPDEKVLGLTVETVEEVNPRRFDLAFSALPSSIARGLEGRFARHIPVFSTASAYRYEDDVPVLIPEVNPGHAGLVEVQREGRGWGAMSSPGPTAPRWGW